MPAEGQHGGTEEVLLDLNKLAEGHKFLGLGAFRGQRRRQLAGVLDRIRPATGSTRCTSRICGPGGTLTERIERVGSVVWATDNKTLFYTTEDRGLEAVRQGSRGTWSARPTSELIFEERDELFDVCAGRSLDKKMIFLGSASEDLRRAPLHAGRHADCAR